MTIERRIVSGFRDYPITDKNGKPSVERVHYSYTVTTGDLDFIQRFESTKTRYVKSKGKS